MMTQLLSLGLRRMRQPKVIAEVLGGILLGPTAFGRIPGFSKHIFPEDSKPYLSLVANIGLCLFLFLVGLEIEASVIKKNARLSATVALAGMCLPFGLGAALSVPLYHQFIDSSVKFTHFMLFTGVAYSITAFPVLCRILTELKLLDTTVGIVVLSAGVGNDIIGWTLLALSVALVNAGSGLTALWILLTCVGWTLFLLFPVKRLLLWLARRTGSIENGPSMFFMTITVLLLFGSAFFTDIIGVHAIFGAFLAGLIVPREGGLAIFLTEKLEDLVSIIFLPLYFTLSGLSTDLGLLDNGITWGFTIAICALAYFGKFGGCTVAARFAGFSWREASTIGSLMSCKGLVELIVLNVGLSAGILSKRVFSMFVLEALLLTFMTTPAVTYLYPPERRVRVSAAGHTIPPGNEPGTRPESGYSGKEHTELVDESWRSRFTVVLDKIEHLPGMMAITQLFQAPIPLDSDPVDAQSASVLSDSTPGLKKGPEVAVDALRLIELSDRTSAVMKGSAPVETMIQTDPLLGIFRMFGELNDLPVSSSLSIVTYDSLASNVVEHARENFSQLILLPWLPPIPASEHTTLATNAGDSSMPAITPRTVMMNPFDTLFKSPPAEKSASATHSHFIRGVFAHSTTDVALFVDQGHAPGEMRNAGSKHHLFLPFFGGPDDRLALELIVQLCANPKISATVVRVIKMDSPVSSSSIDKPSPAHLGSRDGDNSAANMRENALTVHSINQLTHATTFADTVYGQASTQMRLQSETADNIIWNRYASRNGSEKPSAAVQAALSRIAFIDLPTPTPLHSITTQAAEKFQSLVQHHTRMLVVTGRSRRLAVESHHQELKGLMEEHGNVGPEVRKTIGDVATSFVITRSYVGIVVVQAANVQ
ncbi:hypothetical protein GLOTRDRAFT_77272 [Gloeophyllum trabeum ATCC 11539]|uniref:Cation/H+ exchanger transmembrane domain-containing protein n=1 Tax=Gloeophyllum trabeum (strain ATCC 11539 / FP-39264 / Madison 617) TaxID=670483 RepID=S7Q547_GLOTA|nr:uncharacterized protein GLOTRDRAFT_77272 [Gloeophyllum trabeum ATCC 11539]EPQ54638.1 hypothetical protein GLOTRDRAFT_77272 [Gloeophyllum trabeum ATCC 11539]